MVTNNVKFAMSKKGNKNHNYYVMFLFVWCLCTFSLVTFLWEYSSDFSIFALHLIYIPPIIVKGSYMYASIIQIASKPTRRDTCIVFETLRTSNSSLVFATLVYLVTPIGEKKIVCLMSKTFSSTLKSRFSIVISYSNNKLFQILHMRQLKTRDKYSFTISTSYISINQ